MLNREEMRIYMRQRRDLWRKSGLCVDCGGPLKDNKFWRCSSCRHKAVVRQRRYTEKKVVRNDMPEVQLQ